MLRDLIITAIILGSIGSLAVSRFKDLRRTEKDKSAVLEKEMEESKKRIIDLNREVEENRRRDSK